jgi:hypothetical protein
MKIKVQKEGDEMGEIIISGMLTRKRAEDGETTSESSK